MMPLTISLDVSLYANYICNATFQSKLLDIWKMLSEPSELGVSHMTVARYEHSR